MRMDDPIRAARETVFLRPLRNVIHRKRVQLQIAGGLRILGKFRRTRAQLLRSPIIAGDRSGKEPHVDQILDIVRVFRLGIILEELLGFGGHFQTGFTAGF